jgi:hypothetical protein
MSSGKKHSKCCSYGQSAIINGMERLIIASRYRRPLDSNLDAAERHGPGPEQQFLVDQAAPNAFVADGAPTGVKSVMKWRFWRYFFAILEWILLSVEAFGERYIPLPGHMISY